MDTSHPAFGWVRSQADRRERGHAAAVAGAVAWCLLLGWVSYGRGAPVPLLSLVDLGFHELGHLVTYVFADTITAVMGSVAQVAVPLGLASYFAWIRSDRIATSVCLTWAATSARNVSEYIRDAPYERLDLIGGDHDWAFLLAGNLDRAAPLADLVSRFGFALLVGAFFLALAVPFLEHHRHHRHHRSDRADHHGHHEDPPRIAKVRFLD
jgi:hypothetical protein